MKVVVVGGGAAGMMAAIRAAQKGAEVLLLEQNPKLGKKLYITGKGRCNITNSCPAEEFFDHVVSNGKFLYSAIYSFDQTQMCRFLKEEGLPLKEERGQRIFPVSDKSSDVIRTLEKALKRLGVKICLNTKVRGLQSEDGVCTGVQTAQGRVLNADAVILATGGLSYPSTGSTGDGYRFAGQSGHLIVPQYPSLVPLKVREAFVKDLEGLSLRNIRIEIGRFQDFGEMLFTADGVSGPVILSASAAACAQIAQAGDGIRLVIDLKPALTMQQLDARILRDFSEAKNKNFGNSLSALLPSKLIPVIVSLSGISPDRKVHTITREERKQLAGLLKEFSLTVTGTKGFEQAVVTRGGVSVKQVNPSTMESKILKNLYFAGEMLDVDAYTGGFNLQIAWSTGYLAGDSAVRDDTEIQK